jgi:hypothetical protein
MPFKNEYVPPRDEAEATEFIHRVLTKAESEGGSRLFPHPLTHYSAQNYRVTAFVKTARDILRKGYSVWDLWTIDHEREAVLVYSHGGSQEAPNDCGWEFIDTRGHYQVSTTQLSRVELSPQELAATFQIKYYWGGHGRSVPGKESLVLFKEALDEYHRYSLFNFDAYPRRQIKLLEPQTGAEV